MKDTGRTFYTLIKDICGTAGIHPASVDGGFYDFVHKIERLVFICLETGNFLLSTGSPEPFVMIKNKLKEDFGILIKTGDRINYLNYKIIQS